MRTACWLLKYKDASLRLQVLTFSYLGPKQTVMLSQSVSWSPGATFWAASSNCWIFARSILSHFLFWGSYELESREAPSSQWPPNRSSKGIRNGRKQGTMVSYVSDKLCSSTIVCISHGDSHNLVAVMQNSDSIPPTLSSRLTEAIGGGGHRQAEAWDRNKLPHNCLLLLPSRSKTMTLFTETFLGSDPKTKGPVSLLPISDSIRMQSFSVERISHAQSVLYALETPRQSNYHSRWAKDQLGLCPWSLDFCLLSKWTVCLPYCMLVLPTCLFLESSARLLLRSEWNIMV